MAIDEDDNDACDDDEDEDEDTMVVWFIFGQKLCYFECDAHGGDSLRIKIKMVFSLYLFSLRRQWPGLAWPCQRVLFDVRNINSDNLPEGECGVRNQEIKLLMCGLQRTYLL